MRSFLITLLFGLMSDFAYCQEAHIFNDLDRLYKLIPPEAITIHLASNTFSPGDRVWYKLYLDKTRASHNYVSAVVYTELLSEARVLIRQKNWVIGQKAFGQFELPHSLPNGQYVVRSYSSWMLNHGEDTFSQKRIKVGSGHQVATQVEAAAVEHDERAFLAISDHTLSIHGDIPANCQLAVHNLGKILFRQDISTSETYSLASLGAVPGTSSEIALLSPEGDVIESTSYENPPLTIEIKTDKAVYRIREKLSIVTTIAHASGQPLRGNYSISVRQCSAEEETKPSFTGSVPWPDLSKPIPSPPMRKEVIIYPAQTNSFTPISAEKTLDPHRGEAQLLTSRIAAAYGIADNVRLEGLPELPFDNTYSPKNFVALPTMESFLKEVVPQAKARTRKGSKTIRLRNNENNQKVFYYRENPLMLIDNRVIPEAASFLSTDPASVARINITWRLETINLSALGGLASHGIIAVYTHDADRQWEKQDIFKGFVIPMTFRDIDHSLNSGSEDVVPDLRKLVYWNPSVDINHKATHETYLSDETGEFIIDIVGYTEEGHGFRGRKQIVVGY